MSNMSYYTIESGLERLMAMAALKVDQQGQMKMPTTYCTVLSEDMQLADYFIESFPDAEMEMMYTESPENALEKLETQADLLIVDLDLETIDVQKLLSTMQERKIGTPVILIASKPQAEINTYLSHKQVTRFFLKPTQFAELGDLVNRTFLSQQFRGELYDLPLFNVLQTFSYFSQPRLLEVTEFFSGHSGQIFMADGTVQHARFDVHVGRDALKEMLKSRYGLFRQETYWSPVEQSLSVPFSRLMLYLSRFVTQDENPMGLPRDMLLQNGSMITLQAEKISYLMAMHQAGGSV